MSVDAVKVRIAFQDGTLLEREVQAAHGSRERPLQDDEIEEKLRELCRHGGARVDADRLIEAVWTLDEAGDAAAVMRLAAEQPAA